VQDYADEFASFPIFLDPLSSIPLIWNLFSSTPSLPYMTIGCVPIPFGSSEEGPSC
jgi:hypothetical protein